MIVTVQFPFADLRRLFGHNDAILRRPTWPLPDPFRDFLRAFGPATESLGPSLSGWAAEPLVCFARRALRLPGLEKLRFQTPGGAVHISGFRRDFFHDGTAIAKLTCTFRVKGGKTSNYPGRAVAQCDRGFLDFLMNCPCRIPGNATPDLPLLAAGAPLARLLGRATSPAQSSLGDGLIICGQPFIVFEFERPSRDSMRNIVTFSDPGKMWIRKVGRSRGVYVCAPRVRFRGKSFISWGVSYPEAHTQRHRNIARRLKMLVGRLHLEQEVLRLVLAELIQGSQVGWREEVSRYLARTTKRIRRNRRRLVGADEEDMSLDIFARDVIDATRPGYLDTLLVQARRAGVRPATAFNAAITAAGPMAVARYGGNVSHIPPGYEHLTADLARFNADGAYEKSIFVMMKFPDAIMAPEKQELLRKIYSVIRDEVDAHGLIARRADDQTYASSNQMWDNLCVYMFGCKFGLAVLEDLVAPEMNPNVALEYGFMRASGRQVALLRESSFNHNRADLIGALAETFDARHSILDEESLRRAVANWLVGRAARRRRV